MPTIPTDMLRTFVTVVDERSFTRAAKLLGITQPAVSAQIKRLQCLLGNDLFDRTGPGLRLTSKGEFIVRNARRMLAINDRILNFAEAKPETQLIRIGIPSDFVASRLADLIAEFRERWPDLHFRIRQGSVDALLAELRQGGLDLAVGLSRLEPEIAAHHCWIDRITWMRGQNTVLDPAAPVPLVSFREDCIYYQSAVHALNSVGRPSELVFCSPTLASLEAAVQAGLGILALARSRVTSTNLIVWDDAPLPKLPELSGGIFLREGERHEALEDLANLLAERLYSGRLRVRSELDARSGGATITSPGVRTPGEETKNQRLHPVSADS